MTLLEQLADSVGEGKAKEVRVGYFTTAVVSQLSDGRTSCGLASTLRAGHCCGPARFAGKMNGMPLKELARLAVTAHGLEASIGMAAINAALPEREFEQLNAEELLAAKAAEKTVAVIGHFPFTERLRKIAGKLLVFELDPKDGHDLPSEKIPELLPQADIIAISALTLLNRTFDEILASCKKDSYKILLGPSAPLSEIVFDYGIDVVSGARVTDAPLLLTHLSEAANFKSLPGKCLVTMRKG